ncbi:hypothetical protein EJ04DRAFT_7452 [Polyplosphaeria fusca]|uniref:Uncharacterized protein n=1 Tax=Polyplosphaeria fusca TaxID=682080 RepID=A0A9P4R546_9PLEO|nr:hypothetical protein EJ04DRAFT_7452 [Polyplosphaeria fusca]
MMVFNGPVFWWVGERLPSQRGSHAPSPVMVGSFLHLLATSVAASNISLPGNPELHVSLTTAVLETYITQAILYASILLKSLIYQLTVLTKMCDYWRKKHICGCLSRLFLNECYEAHKRKERCEDVPLNETPGKSYFPCFDCIQKDVNREKREKQEAEQDEKKAKPKAAEKARQEQIRNDAELRAARERGQDEEKQRQQQIEAERVKVEGNAWEVNQPKGRKDPQNQTPLRPGGAQLNGPNNKGRRRANQITSAPASRTQFDVLATNNDAIVGQGTANSTDKTCTRPSASAALEDTTRADVRKDSGIDPGGRAGIWRPSCSSSRPGDPARQGAQ